MPVTYDFVSSPSHNTARIMEFLPESDYSLLSKCESFIFEGTEHEILKNDEIKFNNNKVNVVEFIDDIIAENFLESINKIRFKPFY